MRADIQEAFESAYDSLLVRDGSFSRSKPYRPKATPEFVMEVVKRFLQNVPEDLTIDELRNEFDGHLNKVDLDDL